MIERAHNASLSNQKLSTMPKLQSDIDAIYRRQQKMKALVNNFNQIKEAKIAKKVLFNGDIYELGQCVEVYDATLRSPYVARILNIYLFDKEIQIIPIVELAWCIQIKQLPSDMRKKLQQVASPYEVFLSDRILYQYITSIKRKVYVLTFNEFTSMAKLSNEYYYYRALYDHRRKQIIPPVETWPKECKCQKIANFREAMIRCRICGRLYHLKCLKMESSHDYTCDSCINPQEKMAESVKIESQDMNNS